MKQIIKNLLLISKPQQYQCLKFSENLFSLTNFKLFSYYSTKKNYLNQEKLINLMQKPHQQYYCTNTKNYNNYYNILGIKKTATSKDIKNAYYNLAKIYHPDINMNNIEANKKFQEISEAYEILGDENRRYEYDKFGRINKQNLKNQTLNNNLNEVKKIFMKKEYVKSTCEALEPIQLTEEIIVPITFIQAARGITRDISVSTIVICKKCKGIKKTYETTPGPCKYCVGTGFQTITTNKLTMQTICKFCKGKRYSLSALCNECGGCGRVKERQRITIAIPPGIENEEIIRIPHPKDKRNVDIKIIVEKSTEFTRDGFDVYSTAEVLLYQALLGGVVLIKGVYNELNIKIQPGTACQTKLRLYGKGIQNPISKLGAGDHFITLKINIPKKLTPKQRELITAYGEIEKKLADVEFVPKNDKKSATFFIPTNPKPFTKKNFYS